MIIIDWFVGWNKEITYVSIKERFKISIAAFDFLINWNFSKILCKTWCISIIFNYLLFINQSLLYLKNNLALRIEEKFSTIEMIKFFVKTYHSHFMENTFAPRSTHAFGVRFKFGVRHLRVWFMTRHRKFSSFPDFTPSQPISASL